MQCPFLRKLNVKYCGLYGMKLIPLSAESGAAERCLSREYLECRLMRDAAAAAVQDHCPNLCVEDVHYCDLAPVRKLVPCNKAATTRCGGDGHRYCDLYLALAEPRVHTPTPDGDDASGDAALALPDELAYAPNHMWLDDGDASRVHIGVDAFFCHTLGAVEAVTFPTRRDEARPSALIRVGGMDLEMVFPLALREFETNARVAAAPGTVSQDPYGRGWLFAGVPVAGGAGHDDGAPVGANLLLRGVAARRWLQRERDRLARFVHDCLDERRGHDLSGGNGLATDGGHADGRLSEVLDRRTLIRLHHEFFSYRDGGASA